MQSLFTTQPTAQVEILNFQTFTTEYVAKRYGTSEANIKEHKREHSDEILENIHFIIESNRLNRPLIKWTLRGIIKLGMFIRSKEAKNFRLWAEQELEKSINAELENARLTRERNLALVNKISALEATAIQNKKHHTNQINGYKSQLAKHNEQIKQLKAKLVLAKKNDPFAELDLSDPKYQPFSAGRPSYKELWLENISIRGNNNALKVAIKMYKKDKDKNKQIALNLAKIQQELEKSYTAIGAVMAYCHDDDRFFIENNEILKGDKNV
ncbi:hypothetical protein [Campylobacter gastrosuis]|uniref:Prophage antirepressor n=1 Tax=Campylobacter gastrosuis TaxID=2974576 RepID=A0ABT7HU70_9BACT|nr:hypothetical protein [Campylobacter gastrosuis]MDL0089993.1 hypothetical protein [Campylobacter gastrosuis]